MTETRRCSRCKEIKPITEFYKDKYRKSGYGYNCKPCGRAYTKEYQKIDIYKEKLKAYLASKKGKANRRRYMQSEKGQHSIAKYLKSDKCKAAAKRHRDKYPERVRSRRVITNDVYRGKLPSAKTLKCAECG